MISGERGTFGANVWAILSNGAYWCVKHCQRQNHGEYHVNWMPRRENTNVIFIDGGSKYMKYILSEQIGQLMWERLTRAYVFEWA